MNETLVLEPHEGLADVQLGRIYKGTVVSDTKVALNKVVSGTLASPIPTPVNSLVLVRVVRVMPPSDFEFVLVSQSETPAFEQDHFLIKSELLERLWPRFSDAADRIHSAVHGKVPILLKHHADCDGYIGAIALERSISALMSGKGRASWHGLRRSPCKTPYYSYEDVVRDLGVLLKEGAGIGKALIIIIDNGSAKEDLLSLRKAELYGLDIIVIDHHEPYRDESGSCPVELIADVFINPHMVSGNSNLTAGMLCSELATVIAPHAELHHLPVIAGISDKAVGFEVEEYRALARSAGYSDTLLTALARGIDFEAFYIGFSDNRLIEELLFTNGREQEAKASFLLEEVQAREQEVIRAAERHATLADFGRCLFVEVPLSAISSRGEYPQPGKAVGMVFNHYRGAKPVFVAGTGDDHLTIRTDIAEFNVNTAVTMLGQRLPAASISGGGHELAGTVHFLPSARDAVVAILKEECARL